MQLQITSTKKTLTMQDKIIAVIAAYLEGDTMERFKKIYANRLHIKVTFGDILRYQSPQNAWPDGCVAIKSRQEQIAFLKSEISDLKKEIATEIAAAIAPLVEAGEDNEWKNAPAWANWLASNNKGLSKWFEDKPIWDSGCLEWGESTEDGRYKFAGKLAMVKELKQRPQ